MATGTATDRPRARVALSADYGRRLNAAMREFSRGRRPVGELVAAGVLERADHGYAPTERHAESCCFDFFAWSASGLPQHIASAKHVAAHWRVGRLDLLRAINDAYLAGRLRLMRLAG